MVSALYLCSATRGPALIGRPTVRFKTAFAISVHRSSRSGVTLDPGQARDNRRGREASEKGLEMCRDGYRYKHNL